MKKKQNWHFSSFEELEQKWFEGQFDCDDLADFTDPIILDWCERIEDWAPKVALCFNRNTSAVTLDRLSQHKMPEIRRLVCFHKNCSVETLTRLFNDGDEACRNAAHEYLEQKGKLPFIKKRKPSRARR